MSRIALAPRPGVRKPLPVNLPPEVEIDLHIFCEVHYGASRTKVIAEALEQFIAGKRASDSVLEAEFADAKARFMQTYGAERNGFWLLKGATRKSQPNSVRKKRGPQQ